MTSSRDRVDDGKEQEKTNGSDSGNESESHYEKISRSMGANKEGGLVREHLG